MKYKKTHQFVWFLTGTNYYLIGKALLPLDQSTSLHFSLAPFHTEKWFQLCHLWQQKGCCYELLLSKHGWPQQYLLDCLNPSHIVHIQLPAAHPREHLQKVNENQLIEILISTNVLGNLESTETIIQELKIKHINSCDA